MKLSYIISLSILDMSRAYVEPAHPTTTTIQRVVKLIQDIKSKVDADGKAEQVSFDEYACWCEKTLERKASDIASSKELIEESEILIKKLKGEISSHGAEITQLNKDIAANRAAQKDADDVRSKDHSDYAEERSESEQCIGAMEAAIGVLTGAGTKKGFLDTSSHAAQLLSVAASVRSAFKTKAMPRSVSEQDLNLVKSFIAEPVDFLKQHSGLSAAQVGQNPFGDYAPQSSQIQGILKGMYDAFNADLEKDNAAESEAQKSFEQLMATKKEEQATLEDTLEKQKADSAAKTKSLKENQILKDDTAAQLEADEAFFADTKEACQAKASEWSVRLRLRTEELSGMNQAIQILSSDEAKSSFARSSDTFLQLVSIKEHHADRRGTDKIYGQLRKLATQYKSLDLARIAAAVQVGGNFGKVIGMCDDMIALLRKEEADDIAHRDRCENSQNENNNEIADLEHSIKKTREMVTRLNNTKNELASEIAAVKDDIKNTKKMQAELLDFRNKEEAEFRQSVKNDVDALPIMKDAVAALSKFYKNNKVPLELAQKSPEYKDGGPDKAPEASFSGEYAPKTSESTKVLAILEMLIEDTEKQIADSRADDADAKAKYDKQNGALQNTMDAQEETQVTLEEAKASTEEKMDAAEAFKDGEQKDAKGADSMLLTLGTDCAWIREDKSGKSHFKIRREKRKDEIQGLVDAKAFLAGVDAGEDPLAML